MTTLTQRKREAFPERYARSDARTAIYKALYGPQKWTDTVVSKLTIRALHTRSNSPMIDDTRGGSDCVYTQAKAVWDNLHSLAEFSPEQTVMHLDRLEVLRKHQRKEQSNAQS